MRRFLGLVEDSPIVDLLWICAAMLVAVATIGAVYMIGVAVVTFAGQL